MLSNSSNFNTQYLNTCLMYKQSFLGSTVKEEKEMSSIQVVCFEMSKLPHAALASDCRGSQMPEIQVIFLYTKAFNLGYLTINKSSCSLFHSFSHESCLPASHRKMLSLGHQVTSLTSDLKNLPSHCDYCFTLLLNCIKSHLSRVT